MTQQILLVEDEDSIISPLQGYLSEEGFSLKVAKTLQQAKACAAQNQFDLILLDWNLPDGKGIDLVKSWRGEQLRIPIIMLTARSDLIDKVLGLEMGANDYVTKPFEPRELLARIHVQLRREDAADEIITSGGVAIDLQQHQASYLGEKRDLTKMEFDLLRLLIQSAGKVFSREELLNSVWGFENYPTTRTVDTHILQLRQKFHPELFETVRGVGYRFSPKDKTNQESTKT